MKIINCIELASVIVFAFSFEYCLPPRTYESTSASATVHLHKAPPLPANIKINIEFIEPSNNRCLDAEEEGALLIKAKNEGKGKAVSLRALISPSNIPEIKYNADILIGDLLPGQSKELKIPIRAGFDVPSKTNSIVIDFNESNGFEPSPIHMTFQTREFLPPSISLDNGLDVEDANSNGLIEPGELVNITARVLNQGRGSAKGVIATVRLGENVFFALDSKKKYDLGDIPPGEFKNVKFTLYTNMRAKTLPVSMDISEAYGKYGKTNMLLPLKFNSRIEGPREIVVEGKIEDQNNFVQIPSLGVDIEQSIPTTISQNTDAVALVIGISKYKNPNVPDVDYAKRGSTLMKEYLIKTLGYSEKRIIYADDENAGKNDFNIMMQKLFNMVKADKSDVFVYYNGHGAPDTKTNEAFFVPYDCDPEYVNVSGYPVSEFYTQIGNLPARSITVVLDACFSGATPKGLLFKNVSPAMLKIKNPIAALQNGIVFSSSSENQLSNWYPEKKHGLFTYFFLKGLQGAADANGDKQITAEEVENYLIENVPEKAREQNREQTPQLMGDKARVIVRY